MNQGRWSTRRQSKREGHYQAWLGYGLVPVAHAQIIDRIPFEDLRINLFQNGFFDALNLLINVLLLVAGILAFFFILYGGFLYITAGGDDKKVTQARSIIVQVIIGILLIFLSFVIVRWFIGLTQP